MWSDEFDGPSIDPANWGHEIGYVRNNELQYYTDRPENARIENGQLLIEGRRENYNGHAYTSASLITKNRHHFQYGRIEMRAKLPYSQGAWPAFWTLGVQGSPDPTACWPANGEIDIMEMVGGVVNGEQGDSQVWGVGHWNSGAEGWCGAGHTSSGQKYRLSSGRFADDYHVFAVEWTASRITWFVDGNPYHWLDISGAALSEFRQPHYLLLNLAIGGNWPGPPDHTSVFPMRYYVDYVRVYSDTAPPAQNRLANPGLESGNTGWNGVGGNWAVVQPAAGNARSGSWAFQASSSQQYGSGTGPWQAVSGLAANTDHVASLWSKGTGVLQVVVYDAGWGYLGTSRCTVTSTWTPCSFSFDTGPHTGVIVQVQDHAAGTAHVDDLYLGVP